MTTASSLPVEIDADRLLADLAELSAIGAYKSGVHRPTFSADDLRARAWFADALAEAGLSPEIDGIGNVIGRSRAARVLLLGSHLESQPHAGRLDGPLGLLYGLALVRALRATGEEVWVDIAAWADEEGWFGQFLGSRSFCGEVSEAEIDAARHRSEGTPLRAALATAGLAAKPRAYLTPGRYLGYAEAHIEQGDRLESAGIRVGIVSAIVGMRKFIIVAEGVQNHAGTTRMAIRKDAGLALCKLCVAIDAAFPAAAGPLSVWTTGRMRFEPGEPSVIPGRAEMYFQIRDPDTAVLERLSARLRSLIAEANERGPCRLSATPGPATVPAIMDAGMQDVFGVAAEALAPGAWMRMPSSAGHDAQTLARHMPAVMLFVPSIGGISHHWAEDTRDEDIVLGARVFSEGVRRILARPTLASPSLAKRILPGG
ncbi:MAG: hydantoinase/carbamoylase family amidase [Acetobacteraceae bacterium]